MLYCENCKKEILEISISHSAMSEEAIEKWIKSLEEKGKIIIINPPPFGPKFCPVCGRELKKL